MEKKNIFGCSSHTDNRGMTLFFVIFIVLLVGTLITVGISVIGSMVKRTKYNETGASIDGAVKAIVSWSAANNRLPDNSTFLTIVSNPLDAWSKPLVYIYDSNLTAVATGGICGRSTTSYTVCRDAACTPTTNISNVAFAVVSGGDNHNIQTGTLVGGVCPAGQTCIRVYPVGTANIDDYILSPPDPNRPENYDDIVKWVTLDEMKQLAGCYGATRGKLAILNNELPTGCPSQPYAATVFPEGGVPSYQWSIKGTLPTGIIANPSAVDPFWSGNAPSVVFSGTAPAMVTTYPFIVKVRDSDNNNAERNFRLKIKACGTFSNWNVINKAGSPASITVNPNNTVTFGGNTINTAGCIWYPYSAQLLGNTMRVVFNFRFQDIDSGTSTNFGNGFTFAFIQGSSDTTTVCGDLTWNDAQLGGALIGYGGMPGQSFAVEFDTYPDSSQRDPAWNHVAIDKNGIVQHGTGGNPFCDGTDRGCIFGNTYPVTWLENDQNGDGQTETHSARIEVYSQCNSSCTACGVSGNSYANIKVWIDCTNCSDLNNNFSATQPQVTHCFLLNTALNDIKFGFTEAIGIRPQTVTISNFGIASN